MNKFEFPNIYNFLPEEFGFLNYRFMLSENLETNEEKINRIREILDRHCLDLRRVLKEHINLNLEEKIQWIEEAYYTAEIGYLLSGDPKYYKKSKYFELLLKVYKNPEMKKMELRTRLEAKRQKSIDRKTVQQIISNGDSYLLNDNERMGFS